MTARKVGEHVEINPEDARSGRTGTHLRYIMAASIVLVIIGFAAMALGWFG